VNASPFSRHSLSLLNSQRAVVILCESMLGYASLTQPTRLLFLLCGIAFLTRMMLGYAPLTQPTKLKFSKSSGNFMQINVGLRFAKPNLQGSATRLNQLELDMQSFRPLSLLDNISFYFPSRKIKFHESRLSFFYQVFFPKLD
jgi:hypothetical protein